MITGNSLMSEIPSSNDDAPESRKPTKEPVNLKNPQTVPTDEAQFYAFLAALSDSDGSWVITRD